MFASNGLIVPPCGVPVSVGANTPFSNTPALPPAFDRLLHGRRGMQFVQKGFLVDVVETRLQIGIQHIFRFVPDTVEEGSDGILR